MRKKATDFSPLIKFNRNFLHRWMATAATEINPTSKRIALIVATFGSFMTPFDGSVVTLALPSIGKELGGDVVSLGWVATAYVLELTVCVIPFGRLADIRSRGASILLGVALFTLASVLCDLTPSLHIFDCHAGRARHRCGNDDG